MPFKPGKSGNPGGRPNLSEWRNAPATQKMRDASYALLCDAMKSGFLAYRMPDGTLRHAKVEPRDRIAAARELIDRIDGKPMQAITGADGGPLQVDSSGLLVDMIAKLAEPSTK